MSQCEFFFRYHQQYKEDCKICSIEFKLNFCLTFFTLLRNIEIMRQLVNAIKGGVNNYVDSLSASK